MGNDNAFGEMFVGILGGMMIHELEAIGKVSGVFQSLESYDIGLSSFLHNAFIHFYQYSMKRRDGH